MQDRIRRLYEMMLRVLVFMQANAADFRAIPFVAATVAALQEAANVLENLGAAKFSNTATAKDSTVSRGDAREDLQDELKYLAGLWRTGYEEAGGEPNKFHTPRGSGDRDWIAAGRAFVKDLPAHSAFFTERGETTDFIANLTAKTDAFEQSVNFAEAAFGDRVGTNAAFQEPARSGKKLVGKTVARRQTPLPRQSTETRRVARRQPYRKTAAIRAQRRCAGWRQSAVKTKQANEYRKTGEVFYYFPPVFQCRTSDSPRRIVDFQFVGSRSKLVKMNLRFFR